MNKLDLDYQNLLKDILENGTKKETRNGGTISVFGRQIRHKMSDGFPLLTTKKMAFKTMVTELLWFLRGDTSIEYLLENDCNIWTGDAYKNYCKHFMDEYLEKNELGEFYRNSLRPYPIEEFINKIKTDDEFAKRWGELGPIYGKQWRQWKQFIPYDVTEENCKVAVQVTDQIANLINDLKTNPDSRRLMVSAWNPAQLDEMTLPPCHYGFQVYTRELSMSEKELWYKNNNTNPNEPWYPNFPTRAISLMYNTRSQDVPLGTPFNIASYALLLEIIAKMVNMVPDELITNMGDCHIYLNQIDGIKEQLMREPYELPKLKHMKTDDFYKSLSEDLSLITHLDNTDFVVENYQSHPSIKMPLSN